MAKTVTQRKLAKPAERRLRTRIRRALSDARRAPGSAVSALEDEVLQLIKDYGSAPEHLKERVYRSGERRLIRELKSRRKAA